MFVNKSCAHKQNESKKYAPNVSYFQCVEPMSLNAISWRANVFVWKKRKKELDYIRVNKRRGYILSAVIHSLLKRRSCWMMFFRYSSFNCLMFVFLLFLVFFFDFFLNITIIFILIKVFFFFLKSVVRSTTSKQQKDVDA